MRVLILGATGGTGLELVRQAITNDMLVTAFARDPTRMPITAPNLRIVQGDVADYDRIASAVERQDAVISALGVGRPLRTDPVVIDGIRHTLRAMQERSVRRFVYLSFIGVSESRADAGALIKYVARHPLRHEISDHETKESLIRASGLDWTIVRAPKLTNSRGTGQFREGDAIVARSFFPTLSRADVAAFMLRQLSEDTYLRKMPRILP